VAQRGAIEIFKQLPADIVFLDLAGGKLPRAYLARPESAC
jgi:hypothetical protein